MSGAKDLSGAIVVMGTAACGKTTLGQALASALHWQFVEGDELHPPANIEKMKAGTALEDSDREPFLDAVADAVARQRGTGVVAACSALKRSYRDRIRARAGNVTFVWLRLDRASLRYRLARRAGHFMPANLLDDQLATLETPAAEESAIVVDGAASTATQVDAVIEALHKANDGTGRPDPGAPVRS